MVILFSTNRILAMIGEASWLIYIPINSQDESHEIPLKSIKYPGVDG